MQVMTASTDPLSACSGEENKSYSLLLCLRGGVDSRNEGSPERVNVTQGCGGRGEGLGRPEFVTIRCRARIFVMSCPQTKNKQNTHTFKNRVSSNHQNTRGLRFGS